MPGSPMLDFESVPTKAQIDSWTPQTQRTVIDAQQTPVAAMVAGCGLSGQPVLAGRSRQRLGAKGEAISPNLY